jgi:hypothetical protein
LTIWLVSPIITVLQPLIIGRPGLFCYSRMQLDLVGTAILVPRCRAGTEFDRTSPNDVPDKTRQQAPVASSQLNLYHFTRPRTHLTMYPYARWSDSLGNHHDYPSSGKLSCRYVERRQTVTHETGRDIETGSNYQLSTNFNLTQLPYILNSKCDLASRG